MKIARYHKESGREQPLKEHLDKVGGYCFKKAEKMGLSNTAYLIGILHDMGKLSEEFQNYMEKQKKGTEEDLPKVDHGVYGAKYIYSKYKDKIYSNKNDEFIKDLASQIMAFAICYHHGGLADCIDNYEIPILKRMDKLSDEELNIVSKEFETMYPDIDYYFEKSCGEIRKFFEDFIKFDKSKDHICFYIHLLIKTLYSILIDSDWLNSYEFEAGTPYEPAIPLEKNLDKYINNLKDRIESFKNITPENDLQKIVFEKRQEIARDCLNFAKSKPGIYTLTVPTGGGKTLSSFIFALNHAKENHMERIFYVAPYTSIIEQNAEEIRNSLNCGDYLLEFHSNVLNEEMDEKSKILSERWDYHFIFTTMVQFLDTFYAKPNMDLRRLQSLANSIIIFDEVQTVPLHCISLFNLAVNFLCYFLNCTIILCTATQPLLNEVKRPIILGKNCEIIKNVSDVFAKLKRVEVIDKTKDGGFNEEEVLDFLIELHSKNPQVLLIVNTISAAAKIFNLAKENKSLESKLFYLSSNLCSEHRKKVLDELKAALANNEKVICISTQVVECGVDISFNCVVRSLAGIDSIAQASGRCNRHGEGDVSNTYIINLKDELEHTSSLDPIHYGKIKALQVLDLYKNDPEFYDSLLSNQTIKEYFNRFLVEENIKDKFDFPVKNKDTIFANLSRNAALVKAYDNYHKDKYSLKFCFLFKTARENFYVIKDKTKTLIVPYGKGKDIISDLVSDMDFLKKAQKLKEAQKYSVNVYDSTFNALQNKGAIYSSSIEGVYILKEGFYSESTGVTLDGNFDFLSV